MIANATCSNDHVAIVHISRPETLPMIPVCAWCWPLQTDYFRAHPEHAGRVLTHTICARHRREVLNGTYTTEARR